MFSGCGAGAGGGGGGKAFFGSGFKLEKIQKFTIR